MRMNERVGVCVCVCVCVNDVDLDILAFLQCPGEFDGGC